MIQLNHPRGRASIRAGSALLFLVVILLLPACDILEVLRPAAQKLHISLEATPPASPNGAAMMSGREKFGFYRWLAGEMEEQVFARATADKAAAANWANVLAQRGSIEGVYHGLVLSTDYEALERTRKPADIKALRFFGVEMAMLDFPYALESDEKVQGAAAKYVQESLNTSLFTLKKDLGERLLQEAGKRKANQEKLAAWYSGIVARQAKLEVPFGLPQRNLKDEAFHFQWAEENTLGMLEWELLNREHRIFNQLGGIAVPAAGPGAPGTATLQPAKPSVNPAGT